MKLDHLTDGTRDHHLLRLYDFTRAEAAQLLAVVAELASGETVRVEVHQLPFVESVDGCRLSLVQRSWDQGIARISGSEFECGFLPGTWDNIAFLVEPFADSADGYQWLDGSQEGSGLLLSATGQW